MKEDLSINELKVLKEVLDMGFTNCIYFQKNDMSIYENEINRISRWKRPNKRYIAEYQDDIERCRFKIEELEKLQLKINEILGEDEK